MQVASPGHRRAQSYFSGFTLYPAQSHLGTSKSRSKSSEYLTLPQLQPNNRTLSVTGIHISEDDRKQIKEQFEEELELKVQGLLRKSRYKEVTFPLSVKFAVSKDSSMARPRSPSKSSGADTDLLDQTLLNIRKKLSVLSSDRAEMESKIEELMNGIKEVRTQCSMQRHRSQSSSRGQSSIRRAQSSNSDLHRPSNLIMTKDETRGSFSQSPITSPILNKSAIGTLVSPIYPSRTRSNSARLKYKAHRPQALVVKGSEGSIATVGEATTSNTTIHELPESPRSLSNSNSSLYNYSVYGTAPRSSSNSRRSLSASSPSSSVSSTLTSTPNVAQSPEYREYTHTHPSMYASNRNSLPDGVMTTVIPEDEVDTGNIESLSQVSACTDEGSPKNGSTIIVRRSSLTGQLEHYRKPRYLTKKISNSQISKEKSYLDKPSTPSDQGFRVLSKTRKSAKKRTTRYSQIILPGIETTV